MPGSDNAECPDYLYTTCVFLPADIPGTPLKKNNRMTVVLNYLLNRIKTLEDRVTELEGSV